MVLPCDNADLRSGMAQRNISNCQKEERLDDEVEFELSKLFEKEISFNRTLEELKQRIHASKTFDLRLGFYTIDDWNYGYIDRKNLKSFLRKHQYKASSKECCAIIRRFDLDADARLNLKEFVDGLTNDEPFSKSCKRTEMQRKPLVQKYS